MKKIQSLFQRNYDTDHLVRNEVVPGSEWVTGGEGVATRKWDGTSCLFDGLKWFKRYDAKGGKNPPAGFIPAQEPDLATGHWPGWVPVKPEDKWHLEAIKLGMASTGEMAGSYAHMIPFEGGSTYEMVGPKVGKNPEKALHHVMVQHGKCVISPPRDFDGIKNWLREAGIEGIVWHHPDGRMVKIKTRDFGLERK